jgi:hypothetical protein
MFNIHESFGPVMDIAYYHLGNVKDPVKKIHDKKGKPKLNKEEMILNEYPSVKCQVFKTPGNTWLPLMGKVFFHNAGTGRFYRTTERMIYLRKPQVRDIMLNTGIRENEAMDISFAAKKWERENKMESVVIKMDEIKKIKRKPGRGITLKVEDKRGRFIVTFGSALVAFI